jgi:hypothetical protein
MPPVPNFFDQLVLLHKDGSVTAQGPLGPGEFIEELCAWIVQRDRADGNDAAVNAMTTEPEGSADFDQVPGVYWRLPLKKISTAKLGEGPAFAAGVALMNDSYGKQTVSIWARQVYLKEQPA